MIFDGPGATPADADESFEALMERLFDLARKGMELGLDRVERVLGLLGDPQVGLRSVHIAGSNGKGSTAAFVASILSGRGTVGVFTSPHLESVTERVKLGCNYEFRDVDRDTLRAAVDAIEVVDPGFEVLRFFEVMTVAAIMIMKDAAVDVAVFEAGLGARLDATRLVDAHVSVLTSLALEHTHILGDTIEAIAREKVAVLRPGRPLVSATSHPVVVESAAASGSVLYAIGDRIDVAEQSPGTYRFTLSDRVLDDVTLSLLGQHQARNALLAAQTAVLMEPTIDDVTLRTGLANARWPGRMERFVAAPDGPTFILDGAHNPSAARALAEALKALGAPVHFLFGAMVDKDVESMLAALSPLAVSWSLTRVDYPRAADPEVLAAALEAIAPGARSAAYGQIDAALDAVVATARLDGGTVVVCGSLYLVGAVRPKLAARFGTVLR